jgi:hypothetical protein
MRAPPIGSSPLIYSEPHRLAQTFMRRERSREADDIFVHRAAYMEAPAS